MILSVWGTAVKKTPSVPDIAELASPPNLFILKLFYIYVRALKTGQRICVCFLSAFP